MKKEFLLPDEDATVVLGEKIAKALKSGAFIALRGDLGAGKTVFVRGLAKGLGVSEHITSPTFPILCQYQGTKPLYHFDLYRIDQEQCIALGFDDFFYDPALICAVEWSERLQELPRHAITVELFSVSVTERRAVVDYDPALFKGDFA